MMNMQQQVQAMNGTTKQAQKTHDPKKHMELMQQKWTAGGHGPDGRQVCRYLVKGFGTSESRKSTR